MIFEDKPCRPIIISKRLDTYLKALHERGVHFVICKRDKAALQEAWQLKAASLNSVLKHYAHDGLLGFIPGRSGLWVLDIDKFPGENKNTGDLLANVSALATVTTPRGHHVYFKKASSNPVGNRAWAVGGYSGDIRADHGYAICWELGKLVDALDRTTGRGSYCQFGVPSSQLNRQARGAGRNPPRGNRNNDVECTTVFQEAAQQGAEPTFQWSGNARPRSLRAWTTGEVEDTILKR